MLNTMCSLYSRLEKLELVKFAIDSSLEEALKKLPKLKSLTVWPDNTSEVSNVLWKSITYESQVSFEMYAI